MDTNLIWILKFRDFTIKDLKLGVRSKDAAKSALRFFTEKGYILQMNPDWEWKFLNDLVKTHPVHKKDFEHFLMKTRRGIKPSEIMTELKSRSDYIPTLAVVKLVRAASPDPYQWEVEMIEKIEDATALYNLQKDIEAV